MVMERDDRVRDYIMPEKILWTTGGSTVERAEELLRTDKQPQATLGASSVCQINAKGGILLDFGKQYHGGVQIITHSAGGASGMVRIRFGESAMEAMSDIGQKNSTNNHAIRDAVVPIPFMGSLEFGNTAFRFVRIDSMQEEPITLKMVRAIYLHRDLKLQGSFKCSDEMLNKIWDIGAYTVYLNTQEFIWDGAKRDRLVWIGDMHPETSTIQAIFGYDKAVPRSLDLIRDETPADQWMNGIPTYSMWWIRIHHDWYMQNGDLDYLKQQKDYLLVLLNNIFKQINEDGTNKIENKFIDWPSESNKIASEAGLHAMLVSSTKAGKELCKILGEYEMVEKCDETLEKLRKYVPDTDNNKQAAALLALAGILDKKKTNDEILAPNQTDGISTFLGYYVLKARSEAGDIEGTIDLVKKFWGAMVNLGATTFWEDFKLEWANGAKPIDSILTEDEYDVHGDNGAYCYIGFRHSLCHGWASGPTAWMSEYILGVKVLEPGCKTVKITPNMGNLDWVEGDYPTPYGNIHIKHVKSPDGLITSSIQAPSEIKVIQ